MGDVYRFKKTPFGTVDGRAVTEFTLDNGSISFSVLDYGCTLRTLSVPGKEGRPVDIVLGYDSVEQYRDRSGRMGATIGRCCNRIRNGSFLMDGGTVQLSVNRPPHHIHGGFRGFDKRIWEMVGVGDNEITFRYRSEDGEEGYPGNLTVDTTYGLNGDSLSISFRAVSDRDTVCNLTNHSYFNLSGSGSIDGHQVSIRSGRYTPTDDEGVPTGEIADVSEGMDLREPTVMDPKKVFDTNYILDGGRGCVRCSSDESGIVMTVDTDYPAVQFYSGDGLKPTIGKYGVQIGPRSGMCFETQFPPDTPNNPSFGSITLRKGEMYEHRTRFIFSKMH
jgi:aldose 1-epimerase